MTITKCDSYFAENAIVENPDIDEMQVSVCFCFLFFFRISQATVAGHLFKKFTDVTTICFCHVTGIVRLSLTLKFWQ